MSCSTRSKLEKNGFNPCSKRWVESLGSGSECALSQRFVRASCMCGCDLLGISLLSASRVYHSVMKLSTRILEKLEIV